MSTVYLTRLIDRAMSVIAAVVVDLVLLVALMLGAGRPDDARVLCRDPGRSSLSADMPLTSVTQTPGGWVLYFPRGGLSSGRSVEVWQDCEVHQ